MDTFLDSSLIRRDAWVACISNERDYRSVKFLNILPSAGAAAKSQSSRRSRQAAGARELGAIRSQICALHDGRREPGSHEFKMLKGKGLFDGGLGHGGEGAVENKRRAGKNFTGVETLPLELSLPS
jgi:hypothetical protein